MKKLAPWVLCLFAFGCNSNGSGASLSTLTPVTSDATCPAGGVKLSVGTDKNGNGKLDSDEVKDTQEICNGAKGSDGMNGQNGADGGNGTSGVSSLANATALQPGDAHCPTGGTQLDFGLDNGANGGTAGDGVLQSGEVLSTSYVCNGAAAGERYYPADVTAPTAPAGQYSIIADSVPGTTGAGSNGGSVSLQLSPGSLGGGVKVFNTGAADAGFTLPTAPAFVAGALPLSITADQSLKMRNDVAECLEFADTYCLVLTDNNIYVGDGGTYLPVSSLSVAAGATLTVDVGFLSSSASLSVRNDVHNAGTITVTKIGNQPDNSPALGIIASNFYGDIGSSIVTRGADVTVDGGIGGQGGPVDIEVGALLINRGSIDTSGGTGETGGSGGDIHFGSSFGAIYNTGSLTTRGAGGSVNGAGSSGLVQFNGWHGAYNSGAIDTSGADGVTSAASAGAIDIETGSVSTLKSSGSLTAKGGSCTGTNCTGGNGGQVILVARSGNLFHNATIESSAGTGQGNGGNGGYVSFQAQEAYSNWSEVQLAAGSIYVSGNISCRGGAGNPSGYGGGVTIRDQPTNQPQGQEVVLLGYTTIDVSGSAGTNALGGGSGYVELYTDPSAPIVSEGTYGGLASGPVVNYADIKANGGDGTTGGSGGGIRLHTQTSYDFHQALEKVINYGNLTANAGLSSVGNGSGGGLVFLSGMSGSENHGALTSNGGTQSGGPSVGGSGGTIQIVSDDGPVTNTGVCVANGGGSSGNGGNGGGITLDGTQVTNSANLTANGANATLLGGAGGTITLGSSAAATANTGTFSVAGGTGTPDGIKGVVRVDGVDVTP